MMFVRKLHKWLGLLLAVQFLAWTLSGSVFAWLDSHAVSAQAALQAPQTPLLPASIRVQDPASWLHEYGRQPIHELRLQAVDQQWVWRVQLADRVELRRAADGGEFRLDEQAMRRLAQYRYAGEGQLQALTLLPSGDRQARTTAPVWRARFDDIQQTTLYFSAEDGRLLLARNASTEVFDFFFMLHTMDYSTGNDFNNPLVITAATMALWLSLCGVLLLIRSLRVARL